MNRNMVAIFIVTIIMFTSFSTARAGEIDSGRYIPSILPHTNIQYWDPFSLSETSSLSLNHSDPQLNGDDALKIDTMNNVSDFAYFTRYIEVQNGDKIELEAKVKLDNYSGYTTYGGCGIAIEDDKNEEFLIIRPDGIYTFNSHVLYAMNTMDNYHVYRIVAQGSSVKVYVDGSTIPVIDSSFNPPPFWSPRLMVGFGDGSGGASSTSSWAYVKYKVERN